MPKCHTYNDRIFLVGSHISLLLVCLLQPTQGVFPELENHATLPECLVLAITRLLEACVVVTQHLHAANTLADKL